MLAYLMLICALALSGAAAFYSIVGLVAIFAASPVPIIVMGGLLEASKLVVASWLYRNWSPIPILLRLYFIIALLVLMFLTSMGIFGFLSKAHIDQGVESRDNTVVIEQINSSIEVEKQNIAGVQTVIDQLDQTVQTLVEAQRIRGPDGAIAVRQSQQEERARYTDTISEANQRIADLEQERLALTKQQIAFEAEVGPIKYIAALIYGDNPNATILEKAVRIVILLIVFVFDPLAVLMLIAANWSFVHKPISRRLKLECEDAVGVVEGLHLQPSDLTLTDHRPN